MSRSHCLVCHGHATHTMVVTIQKRRRGKVVDQHREARHYCDTHAPAGSIKMIAR